MNRRIFHGNIKPNDIAHALMAQFNRGNFQAQVVGTTDKMAVQIATRMGALSGGQTAMTINIESIEDGIMVDLGEQAWFGVAASIGQTAFSALRNPFSLIGRLDDLAQDFESIQLSDRIWRCIDQTVVARGASYTLSERFTRICCEYCGTANALGACNCIACGATMGEAHPTTCANCGFSVAEEEAVCPNCNQKLHQPKR
ncbi:MAG TPA: zinc ribbon domain-containing protein [Anaerolineales bacterium]|nr:zinc ribbon domain-containing protein [Anaerolineales bacterium]